MKILLSWIAFNNDLKEDEDTGQLGGPTLHILREQSFDVLHLFSNDTDSQEKASALKRHVHINEENEFNVKKIELEFLALRSPTDYKTLWDKLPKKVEQILSKYDKYENEIFINLSAGTPAMNSTWMMMVGTGELNATMLSPQYDKSTKSEYLDVVDAGIYPFVSKIKNKIDSDLGIIQQFESEKMKELYRTMLILSRGTNTTIWLRGEPGTGKTTLAHDIHERSDRSEKPFVEVVCTQLSGVDINVTQKLVFGSVDGIATGTKENRGFFEQAHGGTLFLDEIGDISMPAQRLLIQALVNKKYRPLGSDIEKESNFQLILATNRDINEMILNGQLGQDFYDRFSAAEYTIPPLRERPEDIPILVDSLLKSPLFPELELDEIGLEYLINSLQDLRLPGNVRDIQNILQALNTESLLINPDPITPEIIEQKITEKDSPTKHDDFAATVKHTIDQWSRTKSGKSGEKWWDAVLDAALLELLKSEEYIKPNSGGLNYLKLSKSLGVDQKTIKSRIEKNTSNVS